MFRTHSWSLQFRYRLIIPQRFRHCKQSLSRWIRTTFTESDSKLKHPCCIHSNPSQTNCSRLKVGILAQFTTTVNWEGGVGTITISSESRQSVKLLWWSTYSNFPTCLDYVKLTTRFFADLRNNAIPVIIEGNSINRDWKLILWRLLVEWSPTAVLSMEGQFMDFPYRNVPSLYYLFTLEHAYYKQWLHKWPLLC